MPSLRKAAGRCAASWQLLPYARRALQQVLELLLPEFRHARGAVTGGVLACGDQVVAAVLHALDLALEDPELGRVALVVGRIHGQQGRLDALQSRRSIEVARRVPLQEGIVGVERER